MNSQGLEAMFPSLDISFMSENCDRKGCNLGIRLNINFSNKTLLFCLMVRQKNVYNLYMCFVSTKCTFKKCCAKKGQLFCSMERHQKRGTRRKQENKKTRKQELLIGPTQKSCSKKTCGSNVGSIC